MPYYKHRRALCPLSPEILSKDLVSQLISGQSDLYGDIPGGYFGIRARAVEDYRGFYVARSLHFNRPAGPDGEGRCYWLCLIGDALDGRITPLTNKSPWTEKDIPTEADIEAHWRPLDKPEDIRDMQALLAEILHKVQNEKQEPKAPPVSTEDKRNALRRERVNIRALTTYCEMLGRDDPDTKAQTENHVLPAAQAPAKYLSDIGLIRKMSLAGCKNFTWRDTILFGYFRKTGFLAEIDWKAEPADITDVLQTILNLRAAGIQAPVLSEDLSTEVALYRAATQLSEAGWDLVLIGDEGDSYICTLIATADTSQFLKLGREIGLKTERLLPEKNTSLLARLFGKK